MNTFNFKHQNHKAIIVVLLVTLFLTISGCGESSDTAAASTTTATTKTIIIGHDGVDFSAENGGGECDGTTTIEWGVQDGYSIFWAPAGGYVSGEDGSNGLIWYSNNVDDDTNHFVEDLGKVSLDSVASVPGNWPLISDPIPALKLAHTYVAKTKDGYVKFNVASMDFGNASGCTPVTVTYASSTNTNFDGNSSAAPTTTSTVKTASSVVMGHFNGVDFSAGEGDNITCTSTTNVAWGNQDGYITSWAPTTGGYVAGESNGSGLWFTSNVDDTTYYLVENMGAVSLDSVTSVSNNWPLITAAIPALKVGNTYVAKTHDGYVKFNVTATDSSLTCSPVSVDYVVTTSTTF